LYDSDRQQGNEMGLQNATLLKKSPVYGLTRKNAFWAIFCEIASNPVGRVLLYRLLIEIRRDNGTGVGTQEHEFNCEDPLFRRYARSLTIFYSTGNIWSYNTGNDFSYIRCSFDNYKNGNRELEVMADIVVATNDNKTVYSTKKMKIAESYGYDISSALFHEMIHWYQSLRNKLRYDTEFTRSIGDDMEFSQGMLPYDYGYESVKDRVWIGSGTREFAEDEFRVICGQKKRGRMDFIYSRNRVQRG
jgi:hypothetical protein